MRQKKKRKLYIVEKSNIVITQIELCNGCSEAWADVVGLVCAMPCDMAELIWRYL